MNVFPESKFPLMSYVRMLSSSDITWITKFWLHLLHLIILVSRVKLMTNSAIFPSTSLKVLDCITSWLFVCIFALVLPCGHDWYCCRRVVCRVVNKLRDIAKENGCYKIILDCAFIVSSVLLTPCAVFRVLRQLCCSAHFVGGRWERWTKILFERQEKILYHRLFSGLRDLIGCYCIFATVRFEDFHGIVRKYLHVFQGAVSPQTHLIFSTTKKQMPSRSKNLPSVTNAPAPPATFSMYMRCLIFIFFAHAHAWVVIQAVQDESNLAVKSPKASFFFFLFFYGVSSPPSSIWLKPISILCRFVLSIGSTMYILVYITV